VTVQTSGRAGTNLKRAQKGAFLKVHSGGKGPLGPAGERAAGATEPPQRKRRGGIALTDASYHTNALVLLVWPNSVVKANSCIRVNYTRFQRGDSPHSDLRGSGLLGLHLLEYYARTESAMAISLVSLSHTHSLSLARSLSIYIHIIYIYMYVCIYIYHSLFMQAICLVHAPSSQSTFMPKIAYPPLS
jgi:hypothetical protein